MINSIGRNVGNVSFTAKIKLDNDDLSPMIQSVPKDSLGLSQINPCLNYLNELKEDPEFKKMGTDNDVFKVKLWGLSMQKVFGKNKDNNVRPIIIIGYENQEKGIKKEFLRFHAWMHPPEHISSTLEKEFIQKLKGLNLELGPHAVTENHRQQEEDAKQVFRDNIAAFGTDK